MVIVCSLHDSRRPPRPRPRTPRLRLPPYPAAGSWRREGGIQALLAGDWEAGQRAPGVWGVRRRWVGRPSWLTPAEQKVLRAMKLPSQGVGPPKRAVALFTSGSLPQFPRVIFSSPAGMWLCSGRKGNVTVWLRRFFFSLGPGDGVWVQARVARAPLGPHSVPGPAELQNLAPSSRTN